MVKRTLMAASVLAGLAVAGGCSNSEMRASAGDPNAQFLVETAHDSSSEIALSQLAVKQATNPQVKQFAAMMVTDHQSGNQELAQLASAKGTDAPMRPDEAHAKTAAHLQQLRGSQFDQEYMSCMVADHAKLLSKMEDKAAQAKDPQVRQWAQSQVPVLRAHLDRAREINRSLGGGSDLRSGGGV